MLFYQGFRFVQGLSISFACLAQLLFLPDPGWSAGFDHSRWGKLLKVHVKEGEVDYRGFARNREELEHYLERLSAVQKGTLESWPKEEQVAFYLNAYHAVIVERILDHYPPKESASLNTKWSVQEIPGIWDEIKDRIAGQDLTLYDIEREILGKRYQEPLIHFAIAPASRSGPFLSREPFEGKELTRQLHQLAQTFLLDPGRGVSVDRKEGRLYLSSLFEWFGDDFIGRYGGGILTEKHGEAIGACLNFVGRYLPKDEKEFIQKGQYDVDFLPYDWSLNGRIR